MQETNWMGLSTMGAMALKNMDRSRQARGQMYDRAGYGPQETPHTVVHSEPGMQLRRYGAGDAEGPAVLLVPAPIKRSYIWDLAPRISVVQRWLERGYRVYLAEWVPLLESTLDYGLADYGGRLLAHARDAIRADSGEGSVILAGHSLGGILAAIHSCLHPEAVRATVLLEAPLHFEPATCCFNPLIKSTPDARRIAEHFGQVPGVFLNMMSAMAEPQAFQWERMLDRNLSLFNPEAMATHMRVERWTHDEFPLPGKLFVDLVESFYRRDEFMQGRLDIGGRTIGPRDLRAPLASVADPRSKVIPPQAVLPFHEATASSAKLLLEYGGDIGVNLQHVGVLVGQSAHARIWPAIFDWLEAQPEGRAVGAPSTAEPAVAK